MTAAITPGQVKKKLGTAIPEAVIEAVNELLIANMDSDMDCTLKRGEVERAIKARMGVKEVDMKWLDFEPVFRRAGWKVEYDRPGYNESYEGYWKFSQRRR